MRGKGKSRFCPRASKRKNERESNSTFEPKSKRISKKNESEKTADKYCWICHTEANDKICVTCQRAYHNSCLDKEPTLFSDLGVCPECQSKSVDGTKLKSKKFLSLDKLKKLLYTVTRRSFDKKRVKNVKFWEFPVEYSDKIFKIVDVAILLDNINHVLPYTRTSEFYGDVKFIHHNYCIVYGANSAEAKDADNLRRDFKTELLDLEACPECYYYLYCDEKVSQDRFVRLCDPPHDIVWAQLAGHPYWPAKCLKVVKDIAHVRFFGKHEQSNIPISKCLYLSESYPKYKEPKSKSYKSAKEELLKYIDVFERKYGEFPYNSHKTPYKPHEKQKVITEGICNRTTIEMKLEGNIYEEETSVVDSELVTLTSSVANDITPNGFGEILNHHYTEGTETTEILDEIIANSASNDSPLQPDSLCSIVSNFPISTEQQPELEEEVCCIGPGNDQEGEDFNPDLVLPMLKEGNPELEALLDRAKYMTEGMVIHLWASSKNINNVAIIGKLSKLVIDLRKCRSELARSVEDNERINKENIKVKEENERNKYIIQSLNDTLRKFGLFGQFADTQHKFEEVISDLHSRIKSEKEINIEIASNAKMIIRGLKTGCNKKIEEAVKAEYTAIINEKNEQLRKSQDDFKNLEEKFRRLEKATKFQTSDSISSDRINEYKRTHYCCVCEKSAAFVCCLNTSYCSSECQASHADEHKKLCSVKTGEIASQSFVQERVSQQTVVYVQKTRDVITTERPVVNSPSTSVSETDSVAGSTHHKKAQIHHVSASPVLQTSHGRSAASSSRNKRRSHK